MLTPIELSSKFTLLILTVRVQSEEEEEPGLFCSGCGAILLPLGGLLSPPFCEKRIVHQHNPFYNQMYEALIPHYIVIITNL
jgi:hypothetical protein